LKNLNVKVPLRLLIGASRCRAARGLLDWTQAQLAAAAQLGLSMVKNFEAGRSLPATDNRRAMPVALAAAEVEFLPGGAVRLRPDPITFGPDYLVDRYRFRLIAYRRGREIVVDVSREALEDAASLIGGSLAERHARFRRQRGEFEACAEDLLRSQAPAIDRVIIDTMIFDAWRQRRGKLVVQGG
jgi:transcriptional regulator with XRE-family HTH domain